MKKAMDVETILHFEYLQEEFRPGCKYIKTAQCLLCKDVLFEGGRPFTTKGDFDGLISKIILHFRLNHDIEIVHHSCSDPKCLQNP